MFVRFLWWHTDMFNERDFSQDDKVLCQLMERTVPKKLSELCNTSLASAKLITSGFRGIWSHLNLKISYKGRQFNAPATTKQSLIPHVGATLQTKESKSTYVHFHGNALHLHSAWKITGLRILIKTSYATATLYSCSKDDALQGISCKAISGKRWVLALNLVLISYPNFQIVTAQHFLKIRPQEVPQFEHSKVRVHTITRH